MKRKETLKEQLSIPFLENNHLQVMTPSTTDDPTIDWKANFSQKTLSLLGHHMKRWYKLLGGGDSDLGKYFDKLYQEN